MIVVPVGRKGKACDSLYSLQFDLTYYTLGSTDTGMGTVQQHEKFLKSYNIKRLIQHRYDIDTIP